MKKRINLTIDAKLVARAKALAHQRRSSISRLAEQGLRNLTGNSEPHDTSFADRWMGKLKLAPRNKADRKREHLLRKYKLTRNAHSNRH